MMRQRIIFDLVCIFSVLFLPWWSSVALLLLGLFLFQVFYEALPFAIILDGLFAFGGESLISNFLFTLSFGLLFLLSFWVKERVTFFDEE